MHFHKKDLCIGGFYPNIIASEIGFGMMIPATHVGQMGEGTGRLCFVQRMVKRCSNTAIRLARMSSNPPEDWASSSAAHTTNRFKKRRTVRPPARLG